MVLQQKSTVKLWGWSAPAESITIKVSWDTTTYKVVAGRDAKWITSIKTPEAGGSYSITIKGNNTIKLEDVLIGEVWLCGGQSNMEWSGDQGMKETLEEMPNATNKAIRLFYVAKSTSNYPQDNLEGKWMVCTPEEMKHFSTIGYFFGKNLHQTLNSPIGLINPSWLSQARAIQAASAEDLPIPETWPWVEILTSHAGARAQTIEVAAASITIKVMIFLLTSSFDSLCHSFMLNPH